MSHQSSLFLFLAFGSCAMMPAQRPGQQHPRIVLEALDLDHDGSLSPQEIEAASSSLQTLDANGDGQLSFVDELTPRRQDAGADPQQLAAQLMRFDRNGDGVLTPDELPERMQSLFARADLNKDGKLTADEIRQSAAKTSGPHGRGTGSEEISRMRLDPLLDVLDTNHDGMLSAAEIEEAPAHLLQLDKNHDGTLGPDEIAMRQPTPAERAAHMLDEFDTNHDGKLSSEEAPDGLRPRFAAADKNNDGFLDSNELQQMFAAMPAGGFGRHPEEHRETGDRQSKGPNN